LAGSFSQLVAVSCTSTTHCVAVGAYSPYDVDTLVEVWDGQAWSLQSSPDVVPSYYDILNDVSCSSPTACTAVGYWETGPITFATLALRWDGVSWTIQSTPNAPGAGETFLYGVSCGSSTTCTAVGFSEATYAGAETMFAAVWNGAAWTLEPPADPPGATSGSLYDASCSSATACMAAGYYYSSGGDVVPLAEAWDGTSWAILPTPPAVPGTTAMVDRVTCGASAACIASGYWSDAAGDVEPLAELWNGTAWAIQSTPNPTGVVDSYFDAVSCSTLRACMGVGDSDTGTGGELTFAERWSGGVWKLRLPPNPLGTTQDSLASLSCSSATDCMAVGSYETSTGSFTLAEVLSGTTWTIQPTPNVPGTADDVLNSVVCSSPTGCIAVGSYEGASGTSTLAEAWDGTVWTILSTPNMSGSYENALNSVSCSSPTTCTAVGSYTSDSGSFALAESWDGALWTIQTAADAPGASSDVLDGVSCTSSTDCVAVGSSEGPSGLVALTETWDGSAWTVQAAADPPGARSAVLDGVSCSSPTACVAVGSYTERSGTFTLAEGWDGAVWTIQTTVNIGRLATVLASVSCSSPTACTAVGYYQNYRTNHDAAGVSLAEAWDGVVWTVQNTPNPSWRADTLQGVSCVASSACTAVGVHYEAGGVSRDLGEAQL